MTTTNTTHGADAAQVIEQAARLRAAEQAGDRDALAALWLELQGLEWVDSIDELAADTTPPDVAARQIRKALADACEAVGLDPDGLL